MTENGKRKHLVARNGVAVCGMPVKQEQLVHWGEADCQHCVALYSQRARLAH